MQGGKKLGHGTREKDVEEAPPQENVPLLLDDSDDEETKEGIEMRIVKESSDEASEQNTSKETNLIDFKHAPTLVNPNDLYNQLPPSKDDSV